MDDLPLESTLENFKEPTYGTRTKATADESVPAEFTMTGICESMVQL